MEIFEFSLFDGNCDVCALVMADGTFELEVLHFADFEYEFLWDNASPEFKQYKAKKAYEALLAEAEAEAEAADIAAFNAKYGEAGEVLDNYEKYGW
jgi:hypothetical protein